MKRYISLIISIVLYILIGIVLVQIYLIKIECKSVFLGLIIIELLRVSSYGIAVMFFNIFLTLNFIRSKSIRYMNYKNKVKKVIYIEKIFMLISILIFSFILMVSVIKKEVLITLFVINPILIYYSARINIKLLKNELIF